MNVFRFQTVPTLVVEYGVARRLGALLPDQYPASRRTGDPPGRVLSVS
ncbi:hypothetical protein [Cupriavidus yeoncheonensis]|nr:hypothetical protein [Cupriavidus yeoncheonensis]